MALTRWLSRGSSSATADILRLGPALPFGTRTPTKGSCGGRRRSQASACRMPWQTEDTTGMTVGYRQMLAPRQSAIWAVSPRPLLDSLR
jgi:hypothetical protein